MTISPDIRWNSAEPHLAETRQADAPTIATHQVEIGTLLGHCHK